MSLSYQLTLSTKITPLQLLEILSDEIDFEWIDKQIDNPRLMTSGMIFGVSQLSEKTQNIIIDAFGFTPQIDIWFQLNSNDPEYEKGKYLMFLSVLTILEELTGEAIFLFNYETTILERMENILMFNRNLKDWFDLQQNEISLQYQWCSLSSPLIDDELPTVRVSRSIHNLLKTIAKDRDKNLKHLASQAIEIYLNQSGDYLEVERDPSSIAIRIEHGLHQHLKARAIHLGQSMRQLANTAIGMYLQQQEVEIANL